MGFINSYKQLEKLCNEIYGNNYGISSYIADMSKFTSASGYVSVKHTSPKATTRFIPEASPLILMSFPKSRRRQSIRQSRRARYSRFMLRMCFSGVAHEMPNAATLVGGGITLAGVLLFNYGADRFEKRSIQHPNYPHNE